MSFHSKYKTARAFQSFVGIPNENTGSLPLPLPRWTCRLQPGRFAEDITSAAVVVCLRAQTYEPDCLVSAPGFARASGSAFFSLVFFQNGDNNCAYLKDC